MVAFDKFWDLYCLAGACWLALVVCLLLRREPFAANPAQRALGWLGGLAVFATAWLARNAAPFWPLHANNHAYHDLATALGLESASHAELSYGIAWTALQQVAVLPFGVHHDGLAQASAVLGALAACLVFFAARTLGRGLPAALLAGAIAALAPVAVRVGHSESPFVVAQLLLAASLFLASGRRTLASTVGQAAAAVLLATGHPLGAALAFAAAWLGWALAPEPWPTARAAILHFAAVTAAAAFGALVAMVAAADLVGSRLEGAGLAHLATGLAAQRAFGLWHDGDWSAPVLFALLPFGLVGFWRSAADLRAWRTAALACGAAACFVAASAVAACVTDALRYQSMWSAPLGLCVALAPRAYAGLPVRWARAAAAVVLLLGLATAAQLLQHKPGSSQLDIQGQTYHLLRAALAAEHGPIALVAPDGGKDTRACFAVPAGKWSAAGPTVRELGMVQLAAACERGWQLPARAWVLLDAGCSAKAEGAGPGGCGEARRYAETTAWSAPTRPLAGSVAAGIRGEFVAYASARPVVELGRVGCLGR